MASKALPLPTHPLKAWRVAQGRIGATGKWEAKTMAEAAAEQGVSEVAWWSWERWPDQAKHRMPRHDEMVALCARTGLTPDMFYLPYRAKLAADMSSIIAAAE